MILSLTLAAALAASAAPATAAAPLDPAAEARRLYDAARYEESAAAYEVLAASRPRNAALQHNLGNALFKSGRLGRAIASFERAFALDPRDSDIRFNLAYALRRSGEEFAPTGAPPALFWIFTALSERELAGLHWAAAWCALLLLAASFLADERRRRALSSWTFAAAAAWIFFGLWWACLRAVLPPGRGVVVAPRAELRHGPGPNFGVAFTVPEGRRVRVLGSSGAWLEIGVLKEGARGWIEAASVERL